MCTAKHTTQSLNRSKDRPRAHTYPRSSNVSAVVRPARPPPTMIASNDDDGGAACDDNDDDRSDNDVKPRNAVTRARCSSSLALAKCHVSASRAGSRAAAATSNASRSVALSEPRLDRCSSVAMATSSCDRTSQSASDNNCHATNAQTDPLLHWRCWRRRQRESRRRRRRRRRRRVR